MKKVQVLVAAMNQHDYSLLNKMNIQSDVIVANQSDFNRVDVFDYKGNQAIYLNFEERGVGLNRNNALMRATGDICIFADDDMEYNNNYVDIVVNAFENQPDADVIIFNIVGRDVGKNLTTRKKRINYFNYLRFGTARIAVKLRPIRENAIYFNQCFGGGTSISHGEDNLFLTACLNRKLKVYAVPDFIAKLKENRESTWSTGYGEKYVQDQGFLYHAISRKWWKLLCLQDAFRRCKSYKMKWFDAYREMIKSVENQMDKRKDA